MAYMKTLIFTLCCFSEVLSYVIINANTDKVTTNDRPIIGILSQELSSTIAGYFNGNFTSYIAASYVKFLEGAGARVVPIMINKEQIYYESIVHQVNGILFPGGASYFDVPDGYAATGAILYDLAVNLNQQGDYFPIWGTCLGFELLAHLAGGQRELRFTCNSDNVSLPLNFTRDYNESRMFGSASEEIVTVLSKENLTANFHHYCISAENFTKFGLADNWQYMSVNHDDSGLEFLSSIESKVYPFYGVQFHPEKNGYEFKATKNIPHSVNAIATMQYFANFFVKEARKNLHSFASKEAEESALIYNYMPTYTGNHLSFEQCYFFKD